MLASLPFLSQENVIFLIRVKTPLTSYEAINTNYNDDIRKKMLRANNPLVNDWVLFGNELNKWSAYVKIFDLENPSWYKEDDRVSEVYSAAMFNWFDIFKYLFEKDLSNNMRDINKYLLFAIFNNNSEMVKYLISKGANVNNEFLLTAVRKAAENGHIKMVKYLISLGADLTSNINQAVLKAAENGHLEMVKYLISLGADLTDAINYILEKLVRTNYSFRLEYSVDADYLDLIKYLFENYYNYIDIEKLYKLADSLNNNDLIDSDIFDYIEDEYFNR